MYVLGINPTTDGTGTHDPSVVIIEDGDLVFGAEEERFSRDKHARRTFPGSAVRAGLEFCGIELADIDVVSVAWQPREMAKYNLRLALGQEPLRMAYSVVENLKDYQVSLPKIENALAEIGTPVPPIRTHVHHRCHAASAFYPSGFDEALVLTLDGRGERDATVVWRGNGDGLERVRTYEFPNSLGAFFSTVTAYLGYRPNNGEGKVMGLAPYGSRNQEIESRFRELIDTGVDYDVSALDFYGGGAVGKLESLFDRPRRSTRGEFIDWEKDLAHVAQHLLEETVVDIVRTYCRREDTGTVALAGGVALNCKVNKRVSKLDAVDDLFIQPVAHDAGGAIGAGILETDSRDIDEMTTVYWGPEFATSEVTDALEQYKIAYHEPENLEAEIAERIARGELVGWMQGRLEMGPRALGNRSILADPRSVASRERVNEFVKHREQWRPFAPSMLEEAADEYLHDARPAPYMIRTFDVRAEKREEIAAVLHPGDGTTRPQTVREDQNPRYCRLLREFEELTGVPVLLNTSFNDSGEPIVTTPVEAIRDFFSMGLDALAVEDVVLEKSLNPEAEKARDSSGTPSGRTASRTALEAGPEDPHAHRDL
jgi:carbamoyltransferase